jgi:hypothetical protein
MASYDDLFGKKSGGDRKFMKFEADGEAFLLVQTGEPKMVPQKRNEKVVHIVKFEENPKGKPMAFDEYDPDADNVEWVIKPKDIEIPVRVIAKKDSAGKKVENFEPFDSVWELNQGDMEAKFKDAMLDAGVAVEEGTKYALKRLDSKKKPYTYSVKILTD